MPWKRDVHYTKNTLIINSFIVWPSRKGDKGGNGFRVSYICLCHGLRQFIRQTALPLKSQQGTRTKQKETKSPKTAKFPSIHLLYVIQQDVSPSGSSFIHNGRWNWVRAGTWAASGTRILGSVWNWALGHSKAVAVISLLLFQPAGPSWCWLCTSGLVLHCGKKEADVLGTETSSSHLQNLPWNYLRLRSIFLETWGKQGDQREIKGFSFGPAKQLF